MRDTSPEVSCAYHETLAALPIEKRVAMVADLWATARTISRAGILMDAPDASEVEVQKEIFLRFYRNEVPQALIDRVMRHLDERFSHEPASARPA
jgi:hypothetical protein